MERREPFWYAASGAAHGHRKIIICFHGVQAAPASRTSSRRAQAWAPSTTPQEKMFCLFPVLFSITPTPTFDWSLFTFEFSRLLNYFEPLELSYWFLIFTPTISRYEFGEYNEQWTKLRTWRWSLEVIHHSNVIKVVCYNYRYSIY